MVRPVYLDYNATTPCDPRVVDTMLPFFSTQFGNAASKTHVFGWEAEEAVTRAREQVAALIGAEPNEIVFTSGATESVNLALKGVYESYVQTGHHIITVCTEHKAVLDTCAHLAKLGADISYLPVDGEGLIDLEQLASLIRDTTILIAVMYANNEIGVLQPVAEIGRLAKERGILFFCDATQAVGKIPVNVQSDAIDLLSLSAHKFYGPKGVGALYVRRKNPRVKLIQQMDGGGHERGMRSGTLNVPGIVGMGKAAELAQAEMAGNANRIQALRDQLENRLLQIEGSRVNGSRIHRLPNTSNMSFAGLAGQSPLRFLQSSLALSSGSACTSALMEPSYVLKGLGLDDQLAYSSLRFSLGRENTPEDIRLAGEKVAEALHQMSLVG